MSNIIQIKHGPVNNEGVMPSGKLAPYELGYASDGFLYIGGELKGESYGAANTIKVHHAAYAVQAGQLTEILPVSRGGTGLDTSSLSIPQDSLIVFNTAKNTFGYINNEPGTIYYNANKALIKGTLPLEYGGTGATTAAAARTNLGLGSVATENTIPISKGGTGATTAAAAAAAIVNGQSIAPVNISVTGNQYWNNGAYGLHLNNSDVVGLNGLWFGDAADSAGEGINFYRGSGTWDRLYAQGGILYFAPNIATETHSGTPYTLYHSGSTIPLTNGGTGATTAAAALTNLGLTATAAELNYCDGVTSNIQTQLNGKLSSPSTSSPSSGKYKIIIGDLQICYGKATLTTSWATLSFGATFAESPTVFLTAHTANTGSILGKTKSIGTTNCQVCIGGSGSTSEFCWIAVGKKG